MRRAIASALILGVVMILSSCGWSGAPPRTVTVMLPDAAGLFVGNDVGVLGVTVGKITALRTDGGSVKATLRISDPRIQLPAGVGAAVVSRSVADDRYIELTPAYRSGPTLSNGAVIPRSRTVTPIDFDQALASLNRLSTDLAADPHAAHNLGDLLNTSASVLNGHGHDVNSAIKSMSAAVADVADNRNDIVGTIQSMANLTQVLSANEGTVRSFLANSADAAQLLADERFKLAGTLTSLSHSIDAVSAFARDHQVALHQDITSLTTVLQSTASSKTDLNEALDSLPLAGQNLQRAVGNGRLRGQQDPASLLPIGAIIDKACGLLPGKCNGLSVPPSLKSLLQLLTGGLL